MKKLLETHGHAIQEYGLPTPKYDEIYDDIALDLKAEIRYKVIDIIPEQSRISFSGWLHHFENSN